MAFRITTNVGLRLIATDGLGSERPVSIGIKPTAMLVLLAAADQHGVTRRTLRDLLWEGASDANASNSLRQAIFRSRRALGPDAILDAGGRLYLRRPVSVDLLEAEHLIVDGRITEALAMITAPVGGALDIAGPALQSWIRGVRARFERRLLEALGRGWSAAKLGPATGHFASTLTLARQVLGDASELLWLQLEAATALGDRAAFEQVAGLLEATGPRAPETGDHDELKARLNSLRACLQTRLEDGERRGHPIHMAALQRLEQAWWEAGEGGASVACLTGESGTGRTWLLRELSRRCLANGGRTVQLTGLASAVGIPSAFLRDLTVALRGCRGAAGIHPTFAETIDRLHAGVLKPTGDAVHAVHDLLTAVAVEGPLLITLDDAHHYDVQILTRLLWQLRELPVPGLLVIPVLHPGSSAAAGTMITIGQTNAEGIRTVLGSMARIPRADWVPFLVESIHQVSEGNPGRATQAVVQLHGAGHLRVIDDRWHLASSLAETLSVLTSTAA